MNEDYINVYGGYAVKLLRLQNEMIQTFDRYQRGNKQTVEVRHVHIHSGAQGVVGIINPPEDRDGGVVANERRRQAKLARSAGASPAQVRPSKPPGSECCVRRRRRRTRSVHSGCVGCGSEPRNDELAGAETVFMVERNMCNAVMRGIVVPPGSRATSRAKGSRRKLGYLVTGRQCRVRGTVRIGKARSRSR